MFRLVYFSWYQIAIPAVPKNFSTPPTRTPDEFCLGEVRCSLSDLLPLTKQKQCSFCHMCNHVVLVKNLFNQTVGGQNVA